MTDDMRSSAGPSPASVTRLAVATQDGLDLRAEICAPDDSGAPNRAAPDGATTTVRAAVVVCHPHPLHGGSMYANVVDALFYGLPPHGAAVLRFNFRGTSGSEGRHDHGRAEQVDALAAVEELGRRWPGLPLLLAGYSFGADVALAVSHPSISAWLAVAPPLRIVDPAEMTALTDPRPTFVVAAADDQFRPYAELTEILDGAVATSITAVPGADHFFVTGLDQVLVAAVAALGSLAGG